MYKQVDDFNDNKNILKFINMLLNTTIKLKTLQTLQTRVIEIIAKKYMIPRENAENIFKNRVSMHDNNLVPRSTLDYALNKNIVLDGIAINLKYSPESGVYTYYIDGKLNAFYTANANNILLKLVSYLY